MRSLKSKLLSGFVLLLLPVLLEAGPRIYVRIKPPARKVVVVKPARPHRNSVWIGRRWYWNGRKYIWKKGYCTNPRKGFVWVPGHWNHHRRGWHWIEGHWKSV